MAIKLKDLKPRCACGRLTANIVKVPKDKLFIEKLQKDVGNGELFKVIPLTEMEVPFFYEVYQCSTCFEIWLAFVSNGRLLFQSFLEAKIGEKILELQMLDKNQPIKGNNITCKCGHWSTIAEIPSSVEYDSIRAAGGDLFLAYRRNLNILQIDVEDGLAISLQKTPYVNTSEKEVSDSSHYFQCVKCKEIWCLIKPSFPAELGSFKSVYIGRQG